MTQNRLTLKDIQPLSSLSKTDLIKFAAYASDEATQDPFDIAILSAAGILKHFDLQNRILFIPFDSSTKRSEAVIKENNKTIRIVKGAPALITAMTENNPKAAELAVQGHRILSVAWGEGDSLRLAGFLIFADPVREESKQTIANLHELGVNVKMITGDAAETAKAIAGEIDIGQKVGKKDEIISDGVQEYDVFAEVFPEDKFQLVQNLQKQGNVVGMTGDGVNDAPALKQADVGLAVSNATDVAKAAASMILTKPGLINLVDAILTGRKIYRRMLTYTLNKIMKTINIALFLSLSLLFENVFVITPHLVMLLIFTNDFVSMSLASDHVRVSKVPCRLNIRFLVFVSIMLALLWLAFDFGVFFIARDVLKLSLPAIQTLVFLLFVFSSLATVFLIRTRGYFWSIQPGNALLISTIGDIVVVSYLAYFGILMSPLSMSAILVLAAGVMGFMGLLDLIKVYVLRRFALMQGLDHVI